MTERRLALEPQKILRYLLQQIGQLPICPEKVSKVLKLLTVAPPAVMGPREESAQQNVPASAACQPEQKRGLSAERTGPIEPVDSHSLNPAEVTSWL